MTNETEQEVRRAFELGTNTVSPETAASFRQQMAARGLDPSATLAKHGVGQQQPPADTTSRPKATSYAPDIGPDGLPRFTSEQTNALAENLKRYWSGPMEVLEAALKNAGVAPINEPVTDTRTDEEREFDNSSLGAGAPGDYDLNGLWLGRGASLEDMAELTGPIRTALSALSVPKAAGMSFAEALVDSRAATEALADKSPEAQQTYHMNQRADFARAAKIGWEEAAAQMKPWIAKLPAETREFLANAGAFNTATAMVRLWSTYQLVSARAKMGGKQ